MIVPALLEENPVLLAVKLEELRQLSPAPEVIEIDIVDGEFATNLTIEPDQLAELDLDPFQVDVHLMTMEPTDFVHQIWQGSQKGQEIRTVIAQVERLHSLQEFVEEVQACRFQVGFALNLYTPVEAIDPTLLTEVQMISVLGGNAGEQGQVFKPIVLEKVRELVQLKKEFGYTFEIRVDIGMNIHTIPLAKAAGAESFSVGSALKASHVSQQQENWEQLLDVDGDEEV